VPGRECRYCSRRAAPPTWEWCNLALTVAGLTKPARTAVVKAHVQAMQIVASADSLGAQYPHDLTRDPRRLWDGPDRLLQWIPVREQERRCSHPGCPYLTVLPQPRAALEACWRHQPAEYLAENHATEAQDE
jgi:hypothetical protein